MMFGYFLVFNHRSKNLQEKNFWTHYSVLDTKVLSRTNCFRKKNLCMSIERAIKDPNFMNLYERDHNSSRSRDSSSNVDMTFSSRMTHFIYTLVI